ncbi:tetratricopeptide repeat protein [Spiribacter roseus]|uniref:Tetratricopeptide repeat protein n=1 Tax=Spiribacter roseus TaxID=1855875 RepID=A0ABV3RV98_9GAMM
MKRFATRHWRQARWRRGLGGFLAVALMVACAPVKDDGRAAVDPVEASPLTGVMAAELAAARGDVERASRLYDAVGGRLGDADAVERGARLALLADDLAAARRLSARWIELAPDSRDALRLQGLVRLSNDNVEGAAARLLESLPDDPGERDVALDGLVRRLSDRALPAQSLQVMAAIADALPQSRAARLALARVAIAREAPRIALEAVDQALDRQPDLRSARLLRADALLALDRPDAAFAIFAELLAASPDNASLRFEYARALLEREREAAALEEFRQLVEAGATQPRMLNAAIVLALRSGADELALTALRRLRAGAGSATRQSLLLEGRLLRRLGRTGESLEVYNRALEGRSADAELRYARAMARIATDDLAGAETDLRRIIRDDPAHAEALNALGYTLVDQTPRIDEGAALIEEAYRIRPESAAIIDSMGWAEYRQGRPAAALEYLRRAHEMTDGAPEIAAHLGEVLWVLGRRDEARAIWRAAASGHSDHPVLEETMERLN